VLPFGSKSQDTIVLKKYFGNLKKVDLSINGKSFSFLFDTGGGETFISPEVANFLNKSVYGNSTGFRMTGEVINYQKCDSVLLKSNSAKLFHPSIGVWDVSKVLPKELPKVDGVLSLKSFADKIITLDLANDRIILETPISYQRKIKNMSLLNSRFANGHDGNELIILLGILKQRRLYWFLFDSGNLDNLLLSHTTASEWGIQCDTVTQRSELGTLTIQIGRKNFDNEASSKSLIYDGSLNYSIISKSVFLINFSKKQIWMY
jgi:Aspartyl protease